MKMRTVALAGVVGVATVISGCGDVRSDRPLQLEPGVYKGATDEALGDDRRKDLAERAALQR